MALWISTISPTSTANHYEVKGASTWLDIVWIITCVGEKTQCFLSFQSFTECGKILFPKILGGFRNVLFGNGLLHALEASFEQINAHSQIRGYSIYLYHRKLDVIFVLLLTLVSITNGNWNIQHKSKFLDRTIKRSSRHDRSHNSGFVILKILRDQGCVLHMSF